MFLSRIGICFVLSIVTGSAPPIAAEEYAPPLPTGCEKRILEGDFNGDQKGDIACIYNYDRDTTGVWVLLSNGSGFLSRRWHLSAPGEFDPSRCGERYVAADMNGDDKTDIACAYAYLESHHTGMFVWRSTGSSFVLERWHDSGVGNFDAARCDGRFVAADVNNDEHMDVVCGYEYADADHTGTFVWRSTGSAFVLEKWHDSGIGNFAAARCNGRYVAADVSGDGRADIVCGYQYAGLDHTGTFVWRSTGSEFALENWHDSGIGNLDATRCTHRYVSGDIDGDGKEDIICAYRYNEPFHTGIVVWRSSGARFTAEKWHDSGIGFWDTTAYDRSCFMTDATTDDRDDLVCVSSSPSGIVSARLLVSGGSGFTNVRPCLRPPHDTCVDPGMGHLEFSSMYGVQTADPLSNAFTAGHLSLDEIQGIVSSDADAVLELTEWVLFEERFGCIPREGKVESPYDDEFVFATADEASVQCDAKTERVFRIMRARSDIDTVIANSIAPRLRGLEHRVDAIYVVDEPYTKPIPRQELEIAIDALHRAYPAIPTYINFAHHCFAVDEDCGSVTATTLSIGLRGIPADLDWASFDWYGSTAEQLNHRISLGVQRLFEASPATRILLTPEAFTPQPDVAEQHIVEFVLRFEGIARRDVRVTGTDTFIWRDFFESGETKYGLASMPHARAVVRALARQTRWNTQEEAATIPVLEWSRDSSPAYHFTSWYWQEWEESGYSPRGVGFGLVPPGTPGSIVLYRCMGAGAGDMLTTTPAECASLPLAEEIRPLGALLGAPGAGLVPLREFTDGTVRAYSADIAPVYPPGFSYTKTLGWVLPRSSI